MKLVALQLLLALGALAVANCATLKNSSNHHVNVAKIPVDSEVLLNNSSNHHAQVAEIPINSSGIPLKNSSNDQANVTEIIDDRVITLKNSSSHEANVAKILDDNGASLKTNKVTEISIDSGTTLKNSSSHQANVTKILDDSGALLKNSSNHKANDTDIFDDSGLTLKPEAAESRVAYVKIALVIDYDYFSTIHNSDSFMLTRYMDAFWHSVDLRFTALNMDRLRIGLRVVKILIPELKAYQEVYMKIKQDSDWIEGSSTLAALANLAKHEFNDNVVPVLITNKFQYVDHPYYGLASLGSACNSSRAAAIVHDNGYFSGILTAVQQIAHTLNASREGRGSTCPWNDYIRGPKFELHNLRWSECSKPAIRDYLDSAKSDCLFQREPEAELPFNFLPGQIKSPWDMCHRMSGLRMSDWIPMPRSHRPAEGDYDICKALVCYSTMWNTTMELGLTPDGFTCDENKICLHGKCVKHPKP